MQRNRSTSSRRLAVALTTALLAGACGGGVPPAAAPNAPAAVDARVTNVRAFARLYGYVRYFHPSDEAVSIDWDAFAVHGAARVAGAANAQELRDTLDELFAPIAPTVQVLLEGEEPRTLVTAEAPGGEALDVVAWQHLGLGVKPNNAYSSTRTNRVSVASGRRGYGGVERIVPAEPHRGKKIRLRARGRAATDGAPGGIIYMVIRTDAGATLHQAMAPQPSITSPEWASYELEATVPDAADAIEIGGAVIGAGHSRLDQFELAVFEGDSWRDLPLDNAGFEDGLAGWKPTGEAFAVEAVAVASGDGGHALEIRPDGASKPFEQHPKPGEATVADLGGGVRCVVPLALWSRDGHTLGDARAPLEPLVAALAEVDTTDASSEGVRLGAVVAAWNVFQHFYPYFDVVDADWDAVLTDSIAGALAATDADGLEDVLKLLVAKLEDGHGNVFNRELRKDRGYLPWRLALVDDQFLVSATGTDALQRGDRITSIDGQEIAELYRHEMSRRSGSERWRRAIVLEAIGYGPNGSEAVIGLERDGEPMTVRAARTQGEGVKEFDHPNVTKLDGGIWYVSLDRATMSEISEHMAEIAAAPGVIFDLRSYPNGNHDVIPHLLARADEDKWMFIPKIVYPDREKLVGWEELGWNMKPVEPHIGGKVVFITSGRAISYAESWMGYVEGYRFGEIVGEATAGANGNVVPFDVPGGFTITWTGMRVLKHDGSQQHLVGIVPTVPVQRTAEGIRAGRDEYLERALELFELPR